MYGLRLSNNSKKLLKNLINRDTFSISLYNRHERAIIASFIRNGLVKVVEKFHPSIEFHVLDKYALTNFGKSILDIGDNFWIVSDET